ncbi:sulfatase-like hydrolase/transferase, partial [bacterium]|nr:sulfatase-like hydrolase/transferase [bacterium]
MKSKINGRSQTFPHLFLLSLFLVSLVFLNGGCHKKDKFSTLNLLSRFEHAQVVKETLRIDFKSPEVRKHLIEGWSGVEKGGVWASSLSSKLKFYSLVPSRKKKMIFFCHPFSYPHSPSQFIKVYLNGQFIGRKNLQKGWKKYSFPLPEKTLQKGENFLTFRFNYAKSPHETMDKEDKRSLAVRFASIDFPSPEGYDPPVFKKEGSIYFNPLSRIHYYLKPSEKSRLQFDWELEGSRISTFKPHLTLKIIITEEDGTKEDIIKENLGSFSSKKTFDVNLASYQGKYIRLSFQLKPTGIEKSPDLSRIYGKITRLLIKEKEISPEKSGTRTTLPKKFKKLDQTNLIFVVLDAVNPSYMSGYGYEKPTTPFIDSLLSQNTLFTKAYAQSSWTLPSTASLFTSTFPLTHRVWSRERRLSDKAYTLAEALQDKGFSTCAFTSNASASSVYKIFQGFEDKIELFKRDKKLLKSNKKLNVVWAEDFIKPVREWLVHNKQKQFFMYIHFLQPHVPYDPPQSFLKEWNQNYKGDLQNKSPFIPKRFDQSKLNPKDLDYIEARYCANLKYADFYVSKLFQLWDKSGVLDNSIVLITSDHGEAFLKHNNFGHSNSLYEEEIHIPLLIRFPEKFGLGRRKINEIIQTVDIMPTFMDIYGQNNHRERLQGRSLIPLLFHQKKKLKNPRILGCLASPFSKGKTRSDMLRDKRYKIIREKEEFLLFDLQSDPGEKNNLFFKKPIISHYYKQLLLRLKTDYMET